MGRLGIVYTVTFSEAVTNFSLASFTVVNGTVVSIATNSAASYAVKINPQEDKKISFQVKVGSVTDLAGNGNVASEGDAISRTYDRNGPTDLTITGTPTNGAVTASGAYSFKATAKDITEITYYWYLSHNGVDIRKKVQGQTFEGVVTEEGVYTVLVYAVDKKKNQSDFELSWTFTKGETPSGVDFGGGVTLPVTPDYKTNSVSFTAVDFRPGDVSTFVLSGFEATAEQITGLSLWFVVGETLGGERWKVKVDETASYDLNGTKELTVTIQDEATTKGGEPAEPYKSFFIFGVDNKEK